jgi:tetratricopeptide (TPR) repeat protein
VDFGAWGCVRKGIAVQQNRLENRLANSQKGQDPPKTLVFAANGDFWTIGEIGGTFSVKASKGLAYIHRLLQHPGDEFHVLDLMSGPGTAITSESSYLETASTDTNLSVGRLGDAGEMLDGKAKQDYKRKLVELREQLEDAQELGNSERAAVIESEIDFLAREISRAIGLGGRNRRAGSAAERARLNVTRAIKTALEKISEHHGGIGEMLDKSVRTGSFCSYVPVSFTPTVWKFSLNSEPAVSNDSTAPLLARNEFAFTQTLAGRTRFVGRELESAALDRILEYAHSGKGRVVMIGGPPGVGKTRIAAEFCANAAHSGLLAVSGSCYDREEPEPFLPFVEILETSLARAGSPKAFLDSLGDDAPEIARLLPQLRRIFPEMPLPAEIAPEQSRRILLTSIANVITRAARNTPAVLLLEDLHWADESTFSAITHLSKSLSHVPLVVVGTYRDIKLDPAGPLAQTLDELTRLHHLDRVSLSGLSVEAVAAMLRDLSGGDPSPALIKFIYSSTEGNPFFVEEVFRHLVERGELTESGNEFRHDRSHSDIDVPNNVRLAIGRRLAKVSVGTQKALGTAALIGGTFTFSLLEAATGLDPDPLLDQVEESEKAGLILSALDYPEARFHFFHELIRQAVIADLSPPRRQRLHLSIANAIEKIHAAALDNHAGDLAHHLWQAGSAADPKRTVRYLAIAGRLAIEQSAHQSALLYLNNALTLIQKLPDSQERAESELGVRIDYGLAMLAMKGWYVSEYGDAYKRARELCRGLGKDDPRLFSVLSGLANFYNQIPKLQASRAYGNEMLELAQAMGDDEMLAQAHFACGRSHFFIGDPVSAHADFELCIRSYDPQKHRTLSFQAGQDPGILSRTFDAMTLWMLGYPDQAESKAQESIMIARELRSPFTLVNCLCMIAKYDTIRHDFRHATLVIEEGLALANEYEFGFYKQGLIAYQTIGLAAMGKFDELRAVSRRHPKLADAGYEVAQTWARSYLAEGLANLGRLDTALALVAQAAELMERNEERYAEPEIHRIKGELALRQALADALSGDEVKSIESSAEQNFRTAIGVARRQSTKSFELRASLSLSRFLMRHDRKAEARQVLGEIYERFTEGLEMPELKQAKALLAELASL